MSSIIVRGIDKPESCGKCFFRDGIFCKVKNYKRISYVALDGKIEIWCPLVEVKTPHGRLGDLDELEKQFKRAIGTYLPKDPTRHMDIVNGSECRGWTQALTAVQEAKTVIEAEDT